MSSPSDPVRVARRFAVALCVVAAAAIGIGIVLDPAFAASHLSADGSLQPYTLSWLETYRGIAFAIAALAALAAALLVMRGERSGSWLVAHSRALRRIALSVVAFAVAVGILEAAMRALESRRPVVREGYDFEAAARTFMRRVLPQLNAEGFRDDAFDRARGAGERRVLVIGDSFAFGFGVDDRGKTFPAALESELCRGGAVDVFNAGVPGADTRRERDVLVSTVDRVLPELVLVAWYVNDAESEADKQEYVQQSRLVPLVSDALLRYSALWRRIEPALVATCVSCGAKSSYLDHLRALHDVPTGARWSQRAEFVSLLTTARAHRANVAVVLFPMIEDLQAYAIEDVHAIVRRACDEQSVPCLDLLEVLRGERAESLQASALDHHLNERGCGLAAHAVAEFVEHRQLLQPPTR